MSRIKITSQFRADPVTAALWERAVKGMLTAADLVVLRGQRRRADHVDPLVCLFLVATKRECMRHHDEMFLWQKRLHCAGHSSMSYDGMYDDDDVANPVVSFGSRDKWLAGPGGGRLSASSREYVEETAMQLWSTLKLPR